ncbi:MAG: hypothetical protein ACPLX8_00650 [Nanopusillaceae archaeon]
MNIKLDEIIKIFDNISEKLINSINNHDGKIYVYDEIIFRGIPFKILITNDNTFYDVNYKNIIILKLKNSNDIDEIIPNTYKSMTKEFLDRLYKPKENFANKIYKFLTEISSFLSVYKKFGIEKYLKILPDRVKISNDFKMSLLDIYKQINNLSLINNYELQSFISDIMTDPEKTADLYLVLLNIHFDDSEKLKKVLKILEGRVEYLLSKVTNENINTHKALNDFLEELYENIIGIIKYKDLLEI